MKRSIKIILSLASICIIGSIAYWTINRPIAKPKMRTGKELSKVYCASCHRYPEPEVLPKSIWKNSLLPEMKNRMGLGNVRAIMSKIGYEEYMNLITKGVYLVNPMISNEEWDLITNFYIENAPDKVLPQATKAKNREQESLVKINKDFQQTNGLTTYFGIENKHQLKSNVLGQLHVVNLKTKKEHRVQLPSPVVQIKNNLVLCIGGNMNPTQLKLGSLFEFDKDYTTPKLIVDQLHRPVDFEYTDFTNDGISDYLIAEFGYFTGQILFIDGKSKEKKIIGTNPGTRNFILKDVNKDGKIDFYALMAQARERISLFTNLGDGNFSEEVILDFPSYHGSSYFEFADLNNDGIEEIIMVNGDNADYSITKKNFHGIRVFENQRSSWKEVYFYPAYGATNLLKVDLNHDGLMDMVSSSFFVEPEFRNSEQILFFINNGNFEFEVSHPILPEINPMTMRIGDANNDTISEIYIGNFEFQTNSNPDFNYIQSVVVTPKF